MLQILKKYQIYCFCNYIVSHPAEMRIYFSLKLLIDLNVILHKNVSFCRAELLCVHIQYNYNHICLNIKLHKKKGCVDKQILNSSTQFVMLFSTLKTRTDVDTMLCLSLSLVE